MQDISKLAVLAVVFAVLASGCDRDGSNPVDDGKATATGAAMGVDRSAADAASAGSMSDASAAVPGNGGAPTAEELANAAYAGLLDMDGPVTLVDGEWQGEPFVPDGASRPRVVVAPGLRVTGDLDRDGNDEAVVVLAQSAGGSGTYDYLAAVSRKDGTVRNVATVALGDRVAIRAARIEAGTLRVSVVRAGEGDAACCPGELAELAWTLTGDRLVPAESAGVTGRLSLETLAGTEWVLREWRFGEPAQTEPEVTLTYQDGQLAGGNGCNRYFASVETGASPGDAKVGVAGSTQMACPEPASSIETRYMRQLGGVSKFGFLLGRLALTYSLDDETLGVMLFEGRPITN